MQLFLIPNVVFHLEKEVEPLDDDNNDDMHKDDENKKTEDENKKAEDETKRKKTEKREEKKDDVRYKNL